MSESTGDEFDRLVAPLADRFQIHELPSVDGDPDRALATLLNNGISPEEIVYMLGFESDSDEV